MQDLANTVNQQIRLAARPVGLPKDGDWTFTTEPVALPGDGGVLVRTLSLSLDPAMRGWMNEGKSYIPPVGIGEVMRAGGIGRVIASKWVWLEISPMVSTISWMSVDDRSMAMIASRERRTSWLPSPASRCVCSASSVERPALRASCLIDPLISCSTAVMSCTFCATARSRCTWVVMSIAYLTTL